MVTAQNTAFARRALGIAALTVAAGPAAAVVVLIAYGLVADHAHQRRAAGELVTARRAAHHANGDDAWQGYLRAVNAAAAERRHDRALLATVHKLPRRHA